VKGELGKVYPEDNEPYDIIEKGNLMVSISNGSMLKLRNITHAPKMKRNMIFIG